MMATAELDQSFLEIGRHCSEESCRQLDFLPFKCPSCSLPFCSSHWRPPSGHSCPSYNPSLYDNRVPACPLCSIPVPPLVANGDPNESMNQHLEINCVVLHPEKAGGAPGGKKANNECQVTKCKNKLAVLGIKCERCQGKFCTTHRFESDHKCDERRKKRAEEEEAERKSRGGKGKSFGGFFNKSSASTTKTTTGKKPTDGVVISRDRLGGMGQSGLAALRRAQQQASSKTANLFNNNQSTSTSSSSKANNTIVVDDSDSSIEIVSQKPATSTSSSASKPSSSRPNSSKPVPPSTSSSSSKPPQPVKTNKATSKRAQAEQLSARKALEARYEKGLLSEKEKLRYAEMRAEEAKNGGGKEKDTCQVM